MRQIAGGHEPTELTIPDDYGQINNMKEVAISEFKAKCLALIDEVGKTKQPLRVTRRGKPVAEIVPPTPKQERNLLGFMKGRGKILGDIVSPAADPDEWEVLRD
jgi:prevent-host-death family protein